MFKAANLALVVLILTVGLLLGGDVRSYVAGNFFFSLDGVATGFVKSVEGGSIKAEVVEEAKSGVGFRVKKHIGNIKYNEFSMKYSPAADPALLAWIRSALDLKPIRKNGAVIAADFEYKAMSSREFRDALISEISFPACDGSSKDPAYMTVKIAPEVIQYVKGSGQTIKPPLRQKQWLPANFRLEIKGLDCTRVNKIEAFTIKQVISVDPRLGTREPGQVEFPNVTITLAANTAQSWRDWHEDFVIKGNADDAHERDGTLYLLESDLKTPLVKLLLSNLGIISVEYATEGGVSSVGRVTAELYCEQIRLDLSAPAQ